MQLKDLHVLSLGFAQGERPDLASIPDEPGVYTFRDGDGRVLYVGKARSLRKRVANYFGAPSGLPARTQAMVGAARRVEWVVVGGEVQALLLEFQLIQEYRPRFNVRYRDDKSYPYLAVTLNDKWPKPTVRRGKKRKGSRYYGPYPNVYAIRETVDLLTRVFPLRTCSESLFRECERLGRPCLYFHIGRCPGPCVKAVTPEEYQVNVDAFCGFLEGEAEVTMKRLEREMQEASERMEFENAARRRDQLAAARRALERQEVVTKTPLDAHVVAWAGDELDVSVQIFFIRRGRITGRKGYAAEVSDDQTSADRLRLLLQSVYTEHGEVPPEILVPELPSDLEALEAWLSERRGGTAEGAPGKNRVRIKVPKSGERAAVLRTVRENAEQALKQLRIRRRTDLAARSRALAELQGELGLPEAPLRIECFDISTLHGTETVGSMVVFEDGIPRKADYRKFRVRQTDGMDDFRAMREIVRRRFQHYKAESGAEPEAGRRPKRFAYRPQLVLIDGGRGQLSAAMQGMEEAGVTDVPVAALAKRLEEVYVPGSPDPVQIPRTSEALYVLQHVRDEAHRFAVTFHRARRDKRMQHSALDDIPGVGRERKAALLRWFGSVEDMQRATLDEIRAVPGISRTVAEQIQKRLSAS